MEDTLNAGVQPVLKDKVHPAPMNDKRETMKSVLAFVLMKKSSN
jgi:hypothetical protein